MPRLAILVIMVAGCFIMAGGEVRADETLAIMPFDNNSVTDHLQLEPLRQGLPAILTTDLSRNSGGLKLVERQKISKVLKEMSLGQTGVVEQNTAVRVGNILGAGNIAFGSFMALGTTVRIDLRIIRVETGELLIAESVSGSTTSFIELTNRLASLLANALQVALADDRPGDSGGIDAAILFSRGLAALDTGELEKARQWFVKCTELDQGYKPRVAALLNRF